MYNYVYRITHIKDKLHYYGVRTSTQQPKEDLGIVYFSSSTNKDFIQDQKENPQNYKYKVVRVFDSREKAIQLEIRLHDKFDVGINESFYNKVKQTSTRFDRTGIIESDKTRKLKSLSKLGTKNSFYGKKHSKKTLLKISESSKNRSQESLDKMKDYANNRTAEHNKKISDSLKGVKHSDSRNKKKSEAFKGLLVGDKNGMYGVKHTDSTKHKMTESKKIQHKTYNVYDYKDNLVDVNVLSLYVRENYCEALNRTSSSNRLGFNDASKRNLNTAKNLHLVGYYIEQCTDKNEKYKGI